MESRIATATIESFREHIADAKDPIAGGVAVASVSASFGMALLALALYIEYGLLPKTRFGKKFFLHAAVEGTSQV